MKELIGKKLVAMRPMTPEEYGEEGWDPAPYQEVMVLEFESGVHLYASRDSEGNGGGALFGVDRLDNDRRFSIYANNPKKFPAELNTT